MKGEFDFSDQMFTLCFVDSHIKLIVHIFNITVVIAITPSNIIYNFDTAMSYNTHINCIAII